MDEMTGWDPMGDDFHNSTINSYNTGAGANLPPHLQPALFKYVKFCYIINCIGYFRVYNSVLERKNGIMLPILY